LRLKNQLDLFVIRGKVLLLLLSSRMLQSVRRHSAITLIVTINGIQEIHPVIRLLFKRSRKRLGMVSGNVAEY